MNLKETRITSELNNIHQQPNMIVTECQVGGLIREDIWVLWIQGRINSLWQGAKIPVTIKFPANYPNEPPSIDFPSDFLHVHVYEGGKICMPLIEPQYWKPKSSMLELLKRIQALIHQQINPYSPANNIFYQLSKTDPEIYQKTLKEQAAKYSSKDPKYFQQPCVHIDMSTVYQ